MKRACVFLLVAAALLGGCARSRSDGLTADTGTIGEVGDARNRARVHTELAGAYYERGSMAIALEELRDATAADSRYAPAYNLLGRVYMALKENQLAEDNFRHALRLSPQDPDINHSFGWFLCQTGREKESIHYFLEAIRNPLYPTPWLSYSAAGLCSLQKNDVPDADQFFQHALRLNADDPTALLKLAGIRYQQGRLPEARKLITRYNELMTPTPESLWLGLRVERRLGKRIAERSYADQLRRRFPRSPEYQALQAGHYD